MYALFSHIHWLNLRLHLFLGDIYMMRGVDLVKTDVSAAEQIYRNHRVMV